MAKVHETPVARYLGKGPFGTEKLREENVRVKIPSVVRWLGHPADIRAQFKGGVKEASLVAPAVLGETTFDRLRKNVCGYLVADTRPRTLRRSNQTLFVAVAVSGPYH